LPELATGGPRRGNDPASLIYMDGEEENEGWGMAKAARYRSCVALEAKDSSLMTAGNEAGGREKRTSRGFSANKPPVFADGGEGLGGWGIHGS